MKKKIALENYPTSAGIVKKVPNSTATLNGVPIATLDSVLVHNSIGADAPIEFTDGVLLNDSPLTFVDAKTAGGATIQDAGLATATIEGPTQVVIPDEPEKIIKSKTVELKSTYAMEQVQELAKEWAGSTFYLFLKLFFNNNIPVKAFQDLYKDMSEKKLLNPNIEVVKRATNLIASFPDPKKEKITDPIIRINEKWVLQAVEGDKNTSGKEKKESIALAKSKLLSGLLEEYGHYLDNLLRFTYSLVQGDTKGDEGATFKKYFLINFNFLTDKKLHFADAYIDGAKTELILDFTEFQQEFQDLNKELDGEEFFSAGEGNLLLEQYGHFGLEKKALGGNKGKDIILDEKELSHLYIGNYMRDMSQLINPMFNYLTPEEKSKVESVNPDATFLDGFGLSMLSRKGFTRVVELLAASEMRKITEDNSNPKAVGGPARDWVEPKKTGLPDSKVKEIIEDTLIDLGLKAAQVALDYRLFVKHYKSIDQEELGVYKPEEHIDSPLGVTVFDGIKDDLYYCNMNAKPAIGDEFGMKMHIRNHNPNTSGKDIRDKPAENIGKGTGKYAKGLTTAVAEMESQFKKFYQKYASAGGDKRKQNDAMRYLGNGLHIVEDFFAHTNFCEISIIKAGIAVHPWVDFNSPELKNYKNGKRFKVKNDLAQRRSYDDSDSCSGTEEIIKAYYTSSGSAKNTYKKLDDFDANGYYFSINNSKTSTTYFAKAIKKDSNGVIIYDAHLAVGTVLSYKGKNYAAQIPLVSSYFSTLDTIHSLVHVLQGTLKPKEITLTGILSDNEFGGKYGKLVLDLSDMIILHMLNDLAQSQKERNKSGKETGLDLDYNKILKYYIELIKYRGMLFSIIANLSKKNILYAFIADIIIRAINTLYVTIVNLVKSILVDVMELVAIGIAAYQNTELSREVGTNPSHSQLAKDHHEHPLHTLAANLAMIAVKDIGNVLKALKDNKPFKGKKVLSSHFIETAKKYMIHPSQSDWMDAETRTWLNAHGAEISNLEEIEESRKRMKATGKFIKDTLEKLKKEYADFKVAIKVAIVVIENYIDEIANKIEELKELANELTEELKRKYRKIIKQLEEDFENFKLRTQNIINQNLENAKEQLNIQINKFNKSLEQKLNKAEELFDKAGKHFDNLKGSIDHYYKELMPNIFDSKAGHTKLQNHIIDYMETYEPNDYVILQHGMNNIKTQIASTKQYLSISPENYLAQLDSDIDSTSSVA